MGRKKKRVHSKRRARAKRKLKPPAQQTTRRHTPIAKEKWLKAILVVGFFIFFSVGFLLLNSPFTDYEEAPEPPSQPHSGSSAKAAIVDGLYSIKPNLTFTYKTMEILRETGFHVDLFQGENVTIDLLRNIGGYKLLILRLHSTIHTDRWLYLFSGELYTESKYVTEQLSGIVKKGYTFDENEPPYFALHAAFLGRPDGLKGSTIILMGCNGTGDSMAIQEFFEKGADAYVGWTGYVDLDHSDKVTLSLIRAYCLDKLSMKEAVNEAVKKNGVDPYYGSILAIFTNDSVTHANNEIIVVVSRYYLE